MENEDHLSSLGEQKCKKQPGIDMPTQMQMDISLFCSAEETRLGMTKEERISMQEKLYQLASITHNLLEDLSIQNSPGSAKVKMLPRISNKDRKHSRSYFCIYFALVELKKPVDPIYLAKCINFSEKKIKKCFKENPYTLYVHPLDLLPFYLHPSLLSSLPISLERETELMLEADQKGIDIAFLFKNKCEETIRLLMDNEVGKRYCDNQCCKNVILGVICYNAFTPVTPKRHTFATYANMCNIAPSAIYKAYDDCAKCVEEINEQKPVPLSYTFWWMQGE